jgi:hypothetical protein
MSRPESARGETSNWIVRPVVWYATAYMIIIILHEGAHALTAVQLGFPATLYNFWVNYDIGRGTTGEQALVGIAAPTASLLAGVVCWVIYGRVKNSMAGLPLLYLASSGVANFFGNLMSAAFVGDFSNAAVLLGLSPKVRYGAAFIGAVGVLAVVFVTGRELRQWTAPHVGKIGAALGLVVVPAVIGTALVTLVNQPTPMGAAAFFSARAGESALWVVGALAGLFTRQRTTGSGPGAHFHWVDGAAALAVFLAVKVMARGILLTP